MSQYDHHFDAQIGGGRESGVTQVYIGAPRQRGHGIGSFLGGLFRSILPLLKRGAKTVGKEALRAGMNIISDVTDRKSTFKEALRTRAQESGNNLKRKAEEKIEKLMEGSGYKRARRRRKTQSTAKRGGRKTIGKRQKRNKSKSSGRKLRKTAKKTKKKTKRRTVADIFG